MKNKLKSYIKKLLAIYVSRFPIKFNGYWIYMNPENIQLVPPMLLGKYEHGMTNLIRRIVKKGWVICEVGAYIGDHTPLFSRLSGPNGNVISIEPQPSHFELLLNNIALNRLINVTAVKAAISDTEGESTLYVPLNFSIDGRMYEVKDVVRKRQKTETITIDRLLNQYKSVDLIKMDIQGWEEKALKGARKTINKNPNLRLIVELWPKGLKEAGANPLKFLESLKNFGFNIYLINEFSGELKKISNFPKLINETDGGVGGFVDLICSRQKLRPNFKN